jgi:hypothetical protein
VATVPAFTVGTNALNSVNVSAANTARDGTGTIVTLVTAVAAGTVVRGVQLKAAVTTAQACILFWTSSDSGSTWKLLDEVTVAAITPSNTTPSWSFNYRPPDPQGLILPGSTWRLGFTSTIAQSTNAIAYGGDLT